MAAVTYPAIPDPDSPDGPPLREARDPFEVPDSDEALLAYYAAEGATVERGVVVESAQAPAEFDGQKYVEPVEVVQLPDGALANAADVVPPQSASRADLEQAARDLGVSDDAIAQAGNKQQLTDVVAAARDASTVEQ